MHIHFLQLRNCAIQLFIIITFLVYILYPMQDLNFYYRFARRPLPGRLSWASAVFNRSYHIRAAAGT